MGHKDVVLIVVLSGVDLREVMHNDDVSVVGALSKVVHVLHEAISLVMCQLLMFFQLLSFLLFFFSILSWILLSKVSVKFSTVWAACWIVDMVDSFLWQY